MDNLKSYFNGYPARNEVFETSDGFLFHHDGDAALHAKTLADKEVTMHTRAAVKRATEIVEGKTEPVITAIEEHKIPGSADNNGTVIPAESIQIPVSPDVQQQVNVLESATGNPVTSTAGATDAPPENQMPQTIIGNPVTTASGQNVANVNDGSKPLTKAQQKAADKAAPETDKGGK